MSRRIAPLVISVVVIVVVGIFAALLSSVIWPGQVAHLAPIFCEAPTSSAMVVSDTFSDGDGTSTNFTLYCVGPRGQTVDAGWLLPFLVLWGVYSLVLATVVGVVGVNRRRRKRLTRSAWEDNHFGDGTVFRVWRNECKRGAPDQPRQVCGTYRRFGAPATVGRLCDRQ